VETLKELGIPKTGWWKLVSDGRVSKAGDSFSTRVSRINAGIEHLASLAPEYHPVVTDYSPSW
jgi:hypothetical protein